MSRYPHHAMAAALFLSVAGCALNNRPTLKTDEMAELWSDPVDLEQRDLFYGPGGRERAPGANDRFGYLGSKVNGTNPGFDVKDGRGRNWSVKTGEEARIEVAISRLVWAVGYQQPDLYFVPRWTLTHDGKDSVVSGLGSRFRLEPENIEKASGWSWKRNPFLATRPFVGLSVLMAMINNWDVKTAQNALYEVKRGDSVTQRRYVVRDLGGSLGKSGWVLFWSKGDSAGFRKERFIDSVAGNRVYFHYLVDWREPQLLDDVTPADVRWICRLLARLSPSQWSDAFRAGGFRPEEAAPFIARLQEKVKEGLDI